jgi:hypothetical protein
MIFLGCTLLASLIFVNAQSPALDGTWTLESITVNKTENSLTSKVNVTDEVKDDTNLGIFEKIRFDGVNMTVYVRERVITSPATISSNLIGYDANPVPLTYTWSIVQGKLYLTRECQDLRNQGISYKVSSVYRK